MNTKIKSIGIGLLVFFLCLVFLHAAVPKANPEEKKAEVVVSNTSEAIASSAEKEEQEKPVDSHLDLSPLKKKIDQYIKEEEIDPEEIGWYVIDLESNQAIGLHENTYFYAASTYKLPLAMLWYDKLDASQREKTKLRFDELHYEEGGPIGIDYEFGSMIPVEELLEAMIVQSDNSAAHILYSNLGGWTKYKEMLQKYDSSQKMNEKYLSYDNEFTPKNMGNILKYLYIHRHQYQDLIEDMEESAPGEFLDLNLGIDFPQKYGSYDYSYNAVGFSPSNHPYAIVIDTMLGDYGAYVIGDINEIVYDFFNQEEEKLPGGS